MISALIISVDNPKSCKPPQDFLVTMHCLILNKLASCTTLLCIKSEPLLHNSKIFDTGYMCGSLAQVAELIPELRPLPLQAIMNLQSWNERYREELGASTIKDQAAIEAEQVSLPSPMIHTSES